MRPEVRSADDRSASSFWVVLNNYLTAPLQIMSSVVSKWLLGALAPVLTGSMVYVNSINRYIDLAMFPVVTGMIRNIPVFMAKEQSEEAVEVADTALVLSTLLMVAGIVVNLTFAALSTDWYVRLLFLAVAVTIPFRLARRYINVYLGAHKRFIRQSQLSLLGAFIGCPLFLLLIYLFSDYGYIVGTAITIIIPAALFLLLVRPSDFRWRTRLGSIRFLLLSALPLFLFALSDTVALTLDKILMKGSLGLQELGYYGFAFMICEKVRVFPGLVFGVLFPYFLGDMVSASDESIFKRVQEYYRRISYVILGLILGVWWAMEFLVRCALAQFIPSLWLVRIMLLGAFFYVATHLMYMVLVGKGRDRALIVISVLIVAFAAAVYIVIATHFQRSDMFAWGFVAIAVFRAILTSVLGAKALRRTPVQVMRFLSTNLMMFLPLIGFVIFERWLGIRISPLRSVSLSFALWMAILIVVVWLDRPCYRYYISTGKHLIKQALAKTSHSAE